MSKQRSAAHGVPGESCLRHECLHLGSILRRRARPDSRGWHDGRLTLLVSVPILDEYQRVGRLLATRYEGVELEAFLALVAVNAEVVEAPDLPDRVCEDPDDDKFLACALAGAAGVVVSGDKPLQKVSGWNGIEVLSPRTFADRYLR